jgi:hypothetical protein
MPHITGARAAGRDRAAACWLMVRRGYCKGPAGLADCCSRRTPTQVLLRATSSAAHHRPSEPQRRADWNHRRPSRMHGFDDFAAVDALQVDGGDSEVAVAELALDDDQRNAFPGHLNRVGVAELMWREAAPDSCRGGRAPQLGACRGGRPMPSARRAVDHAEKRTDREGASYVKPGLKLLPSPCVHADLTTAPALATSDQD